MILRHTILASTLFGLGFFGFLAPAAAEEFEPSIHGIILGEVQNDWVTESDDPAGDVNTLTFKAEPYFILSLTERLALEALFVMEQVQAPDADESTVFENEGAYVEQLMISYTGDNFSLYAGKYGPGFGTAWDLAPGIYGVDFAEDYELAEKIGVGGSLVFETENTGTHTLSANTFFADTSWFAGSKITERGGLDEEDGGVSNTEDFSSYSVTLDSEDFMGAMGLNLHTGFYSQAKGDYDVGLSNETGFVIGSNYNFSISDDLDAMILAEWATIDDSAGSQDDINYLTTSLSLNLYDGWNISASYTGRKTLVRGGADIDDYLYQISAGYEFENGITFDLGYSKREETNIVSDTIGALLGYTYEF